MKKHKLVLPKFLHVARRKQDTVTTRTVTDEHGLKSQVENIEGHIRAEVIPHNTDTPTIKQRERMDRFTGTDSDTSLEHLIAVPNEPVEGFRLVDFMPTQTSRKNSDGWLIEDPRGYIFSTPHSQFMSLIGSATIIKGVIQGPCQFITEGASTILVSLDSNIYEELAAQEAASALKPLNEYNDPIPVGSEVILKDGTIATYGGIVHAVTSTFRRTTTKLKGHVDYSEQTMLIYHTRGYGSSVCSLHNPNTMIIGVDKVEQNLIDVKQLIKQNRVNPDYIRAGKASPTLISPVPIMVNTEIQLIEKDKISSEPIPSAVYCHALISGDWSSKTWGFHGGKMLEQTWRSNTPYDVNIVGSTIELDKVHGRISPTSARDILQTPAFTHVMAVEINGKYYPIHMEQV